MVDNAHFPTDLIGETVEVVEREDKRVVSRGNVRAIERGSGGWIVAIEAVDDRTYNHYDQVMPGELIFVDLRSDRRVRVVRQCPRCPEPLRAMDWYSRPELEKHHADRHSPDAVAASEERYQEQIAAERRAALLMMSGVVDLTDDEKINAAWLVRQLLHTPSDRHEAVLTAIKYALSAAARGDA